MMVDNDLAIDQGQSWPIEIRAGDCLLKQATVRLSTVAGRMSVPFTVPAYAARYAGLPVDTADLLQHPDGRWWLHVVVTVEPPVVAPIIA